MIKVGNIINSEKILLVEDNHDDIKLAQRAFSKGKFCENGYGLEIVKDGMEALEYFNRGNLPKFVLLDLKIPGKDGFEILEYIRSNDRTKFVPVIILTSSTEEKDIKSAYTLGANSYIRKPVDFNRFHELTQEVCSYWLKLNENPF